MAVKTTSIGLSFDSAETYLVGREKIREFATAVGERSALCHSLASAKAHGYDDLVAPLTFPIVITLKLMNHVTSSEQVGINWSRVVHGEQRFLYKRPVIAGDELRVTTVIEDVKVLGNIHTIVLRGDLYDAANLLICSVWTTLVERGE
ncbi:MAG: FAS1-like dehydratase domain-containing protein [Candidatus Nanopelagicales bacterium]